MIVHCSVNWPIVKVAVSVKLPYEGFAVIDILIMSPFLTPLKEVRKLPGAVEFFEILAVPLVDATVALTRVAAVSPETVPTSIV